MKRIKAIAPLTLAAGLLGLTACGESGDLPDGELQPGQWRINVAVTDFDLPNATPEQAEQARQGAGVGTSQSQEQCMGSAEAKISLAQLPLTIMSDSDCSLSDYSVEGGELSGTMTCKVPDIETPAEYDISGQYDPQSFTMVLAGELTSDAFPGGTATMDMTTEASRLGDCE